MQQIVFLLIFLIGLTLPATVVAGNRAETLVITPVIGFYSFDGAQRHNILPITGLHLGYNRTARFGEELVYAQIASEGRNNSGLDRANVHHFRVDTLYRFTPEEKLVPFIAAGLGITNRTAPSGIDRRSSAMLNYGVGINYYLSDEIALRGDLRHLLGNGSGGTSNVEGTIGVSYFIGKNQERPVPRGTETLRSSVPPEWIVIAEPVKESAEQILMPLPELANVKPQAEKMKIELHIHFDTDKTTIKKIYQEELSKVGEYLRKNPELRAIIEGHTDSVGSRAYNLELSKRRAERVKDYLVKLDVPSDRLTTVGYGLSRPVTDNQTEAGRAENRRVMAVFLE